MAAPQGRCRGTALLIWSVAFDRAFALNVAGSDGRSTIRGSPPLALLNQDSEAKSVGEVGDAQAAAMQALASRVGRYENAKRALQDRMVKLVSGAKMRPAGWFGAFSEAESTFDEDAWNDGPEYPELTADEGWDASTPTGILPHGGENSFPAEWFHESKSGGPKEAWQTHYPNLEMGEGGRYAPPWRRSSNGRWQQHYQPTGLGHDQTQTKPAAWFDTIVRQYDSYGRKLEPHDKSGRQYVEWTTVTKTANLTCAAPGCVANASLAVFDGATQRGKHCRLTVKIHPTDFDDDWSKENVAWVTANDEVVNTNCDPMAKGCNATTQAPLFPCITDYDLTRIIRQKNGTLDVAAKITEFVDECPMNGFLLNGVVSATCFVAPRTQPSTTTAPTLSPTLPTPALSAEDTCLLQCAAQNCTAQCTMKLDPVMIKGKTCKLGVKLNQTDFDGDHGSNEIVEWIKVDGANVSTNIAPGKNPCKAAATGTPLSPADMVFIAVTGQDVTSHAADGTLVVSGKITPKVDECASNGFLLDAIASVNCTTP